MLIYNRPIRFLFMLNKIFFYLTIGCVAALMIDLLLTLTTLFLVFFVSSFLYFLLGLFLGWRIEKKMVIATVFMFVPISTLTIYAYFFQYSSTIYFIFFVSIFSFLIGLIITKYWRLQSVSKKQFSFKI